MYRKEKDMTDSQKLDIILSKMDNIENEIREVRTGLREEIQEVKTGLEEVRTDLKVVRTDLEETKTNLGNEIKNIKFLFENEIRVNIQRIAEGHLDVSRNIHEVLKKRDELELVSITTRLLESEVRELKRKIS